MKLLNRDGHTVSAVYVSLDDDDVVYDDDDGGLWVPQCGGKCTDPNVGRTGPKYMGLGHTSLSREG